MLRTRVAGAVAGVARLVLCSMAIVFSSTAIAAFKSQEETAAVLAQSNRAVQADPKNAALYVQRGDIFYLLNDLPRAVADYNAAIKLDDQQDGAYFGRGMAYGRMGLIDEGIADLSIYIARHPQDSVAHTKRGVRNIWRGHWAEAERDLSRAVELDQNNAEAHDDLGVVLAKQNKLREAARHFSLAIQLDPSYQKAYHNLAICFQLGGRHDAALEIVDAGLTLDQENRSSLMLKAAILQSLKRDAEAQKVLEHAEFLPEDNWTERAVIGSQPKQEQ